MMVRISGRRRRAALAAGRATNTSRVPNNFDPEDFLAKVGAGKTISHYGRGHAVYRQGDTADAAFYIQKGKVKVTVLSTHGREAVVGILGPGVFFGEGCLNGQRLRMTSVTAMIDSDTMRLDKSAMVRVLHDEPKFSELFITFLLHRNARIEEDLVDQLFNSSEKRLARLLLLLANFGKDGRPETVVAQISQETLAEMIGTTRPRVSSFMNKFRRLGFIDYNGGLKVHSSLLSVVLHD